MIVFFLEGRLILVDFVDFALQKIEKKYKERKKKTAKYNAGVM